MEGDAASLQRNAEYCCRCHAASKGKHAGSLRQWSRAAAIELQGRIVGSGRQDHKAQAAAAKHGQALAGRPNLVMSTGPHWPQPPHG